MTYPHVFDERVTIAEIKKGRSIARYGDGELKLILHRDCVSQRWTKKIAEELRHILHAESDVCITGIMNLNQPSPKEHWEKYKLPKYTDLLNPKKAYYSSFITRPDSVPWINTPEYWESVIDLWRGRNVTLVTGGRSSAIRPETIPEAASVHFIEAPQEHAYAEIDRIEKEIIDIGDYKNRLIILCLGPTATCLAWRLAYRGRQALDLGHLGMFYRKFQKGEPLNVSKK